MTRKSKKADLLSLTQLASKLRIDRGTLARKLSALQHVSGPRGARLYSLSEVEALLDEERDPELAAARLKKLEAETRLLELKLGRESGDLVETREAFAYAFRLFRAVQLRLGVRLPREIAGQLYRAQSEAQVADVLRKEVERAFRELKADQGEFIARAEEEARNESEA